MLSLSRCTTSRLDTLRFNTCKSSWTLLGSPGCKSCDCPSTQLPAPSLFLALQRTEYEVEFVAPRHLLRSHTEALSFTLLVCPCQTARASCTSGWDTSGPGKSWISDEMSRRTCCLIHDRREGISTSGWPKYSAPVSPIDSKIFWTSGKFKAS